MAISTRTRFEIFKRDGFRCAYCGAAPTETPLHVDHVIPVVEGGTDAPENLVTACAECNLGKAGVPLDRTRYANAKLDPEAAREHAEQIRQYLDAQKAVVEAKDGILNELELHWCQEFASGDSIPRDLRKTLRSAIASLTYEEVSDAISVAARYVSTKGETTQIKYLCGILRKKRRRLLISPEALAAIERAERRGAKNIRMADRKDGTFLEWNGPNLPGEITEALHQYADEIRKVQV